MDVTGRYIFGEPCDVSLQGTFLSIKVFLLNESLNSILGVIPLYIKSNGVKQV